MNLLLFDAKDTLFSPGPGLDAAVDALMTLENNGYEPDAQQAKEWYMSALYRVLCGKSSPYHHVDFWVGEEELAGFSRLGQLAIIGDEQRLVYEGLFGLLQYFDHGISKDLCTFDQHLTYTAMMHESVNRFWQKYEKLPQKLFFFSSDLEKVNGVHELTRSYRLQLPVQGVWLKPLDFGRQIVKRINGEYVLPSCRGEEFQRFAQFALQPFG